jgi:hypothetical protein
MNTRKKTGIVFFLEIESATALLCHVLVVDKTELGRKRNVQKPYTEP